MTTEITRAQRSGEDRRLNERRSQCEYHEGRDKVISDIHAATEKHTGQWTILMWGVGIMTGLVVFIGSMVWNTSQHTNDIVKEMDKTFTSYMVMHIQETSEGFRRITANEKDIHSNIKILIDHDKRLQRLENSGR